MSAAGVVWLVTAIVLVVLLALAGGQALRAVRDLKRVQARVAGFSELPVVGALTRAQQDAERLQTALAAVAPLVARAQAALALIRRGPLAPDVLAAFANVRSQIAHLRRFRAG